MNHYIKFLFSSSKQNSSRVVVQRGRDRDSTGNCGSDSDRNGDPLGKLSFRPS